MSDLTPPRSLFSPARRMAAMLRSAQMTAPGNRFLIDLMGDEITARLEWVTRDFADVLILGHTPDGLRAHVIQRGMRVTSAGPTRCDVTCSEDALHFAPASFDLVVAIGTLDSVNDLPGTLIQINRALRPDGLFMGSFVGAGSVPRLKAAMLAGDAAQGGGVAAHIHPQIDVRAAGDLLQRARFAMPVADSERIDVRYADLMDLVRDLRGHGWSNVLADAPRTFGKASLDAARQCFLQAADPDGKTTERFEIIYMSGWAPSPDQPKPAERGSATASLATALGQAAIPPRS
ncbi:methyltransferase domain-containing protein [Blastomonas sp.]|uniref:methyltransferase domain-containing protein n=1 Tax=Blastomonas sp. TaxID=1909299 RepID=UPI003593EE71